MFGPELGPVGQAGEELIGDKTEKIVIQQTPVNLRTVIYHDAKYWFKRVAKIILIAIVVVVVYYVSGMWGLIAFVAWIPVSWFIIPKIAEKFMSYVNLVSIDFREDKADKISVLQIPWARFEKCVITDSAGDKAAPAAPFQSVLGPTYIVDSVRLNEPVPGMPPDITVDHIIIHDIHKNVDFVNKYIPVFLEVRRMNCELRKDNFALRSMGRMNVIREYVERVENLFALADKVIMTGAGSPTEEQVALDMLQKEIAQLKANLGASERPLYKEVEEVPDGEKLEGVKYA